MLESRIRELLLAARDGANKRGINAEFNFHREKSSLIRLGNSAVALSTHEELTRLDVTVVDGRRTGDYSLVADITSARQLGDALERAVESCAAALPKDYDPFFGKVEQAVADETGYDAALEDLASEAKTGLCAEVVKRLKPRGRYDFSGSWSTGAAEMYYISTANDNEAYRRLTDGRLVIVLKEQEKKWELSIERSQKQAGAFTADDIVAEFEALLPVYENNGGFRTEVGRQRVLFGPQAVAELVQLAIWGGFIGRFYEEKRSYTAALKPGDRLFHESISIVDDPTCADTFQMPFDFMGHRRRPFVLVDKGVFRALLYDSSAAAKYRKQPTGNDLPNDDFVLRPGTGRPGLAAARKLAGDALYIPHLHYVHLPDPTKGMFTGSSRFNAMRVSGGEFVAPMFSTRVTDTSPSVFSHVVALSSRAVPVNTSSTYGRRTPTAMSVPEYMLCDDVRITDVADSF